MKYHIKSRVLCEAEFIVKEKATVRETSKKFSVSKSTVHKDVTERLKEADLNLYREVSKVLKINLDERHIRGGIATRMKYLKDKK